MITNEQDTGVEEVGPNPNSRGKEWLTTVPAPLMGPWEPNNDGNEREELPKVQSVEVKLMKAVIPEYTPTDSKPNKGMTLEFAVVVAEETLSPAKEFIKFMQPSKAATSQGNNDFILLKPEKNPVGDHAAKAKQLRQLQA